MPRLASACIIIIVELIEHRNGFSLQLTLLHIPSVIPVLSATMFTGIVETIGSE